MKIFCSISTAGRSLLPAALFGAMLISLAAAVLVFQMRREKWLQALNTTAFLLLFVLLNVVFSKIDRQGDTHGSIDLLTGLLWIIICTAAVTGMLEILLLRKQTGKTIGRNSVKQAIDSLPSAICWFTEEGTVKLCNLQMYRLFRMLAGRDLSDVCGDLHSFGGLPGREYEQQTNRGDTPFRGKTDLSVSRRECVEVFTKGNCRKRRKTLY